MDNLSKGKSPFYPGQPVPAELFTGRTGEINRITRAVKQVELGKPQAVFLTGEYGIGKSSLASFFRHYAERNHHVLGIHVLLGGVETIDELSAKMVEAVLKQHIYEETKAEKIRNLLSKYVGQQSLFGVNINLQALRSDAPNISNGFLPFLRSLLDRLKSEEVKGVLLILDEINGIAQNKQFAHFIKGLVDENALSHNPLPLMLVLCGVEDRRKEMIEHHQPVERIFDVIEIKPMNDGEMRDFFNKTFESVDMRVEPETMNLLCRYSAGFPKLMHIIGDNIFWIDQDGLIDESDAAQGVLASAEDIGKRFVDPQVYRALKSDDYRSILNKLAKENFDLSFKKSDIEKGLLETEKKKFHNFLQRMKKLGLFRSGEAKGEYIFTSRLARLYVRLKSVESK